MWRWLSLRTQQSLAEQKQGEMRDPGGNEIKLTFQDATGIRLHTCVHHHVVSGLTLLCSAHLAKHAHAHLAHAVASESSAALLTTMS